MPELQDMAIQAAEVLQTAHINHNPSRRDLAPSTAADTKVPVTLDNTADIASEADDVDDDEIPLSILRPLPQDPQPWARPGGAPQRMPLPDLRFEQSYLKSIEGAANWQAVAYITVKDQVLMPLLQGLGWTLVVAGWRYMNTAPQFAGQTVGARLRRWWWDTNNWTIPTKHEMRKTRSR